MAIVQGEDTQREGRERPAGPASLPRGSWAVLGVLGAASFFDGLDANIVAVALPNIQRDLGGGFTTAQWAVAGYSLATAVLLITGGRLGDIYGTRRVFLIGVAGFTLSSVVVAAAAGPEMLVAGRVAQGATAALMIPQSMAVVKQQFPPEYWGIASAITGIAISAGSIGGPVVGGFLTDLDLFGTGWRAVFWINVPIGAVLLACAIRVLPESRAESRAEKRPSLDLSGAALVTLASLGLMFPLVQGSEHGWSPWFLALIALSLGLWLLFAVHQKRRAAHGVDVLVPPSLFRERTFTAGLIAALLTFAGATSFTFLLTYYLQFGLVWSSTRTALAVAAVPLGIAVVFQIAWKYGPGRPRLFITAGALTMAAAALTMAAMAAVGQTTFALLIVVAFLLGAGTGLTSPVLTSVLLVSLPPREAGAGAGVIYSATQFGSAVGIALIGAVFFGGLGEIDGGAPARTEAATEMYAGALGTALLCTAGIFVLVALVARALPRLGAEPTKDPVPL
ncbi:MFS transporter [Streptomyces sp. NPDC057137]|uniref:MFS transporter n=1 Tax=Streptomyces sp. NPDC057137 TaxID=3346030 RepID=UPI00362FB576